MKNPAFTAVVRIVAATFLLALSAGAVRAGELDGVTLRVGTWGGPWQKIQKQLIVPKLEAMGAKVQFVTGSPQSNLAKLIAARGAAPPMDVLEIIDATLPAMIKGHFLEPLDLSLIPNSKHISPSRVRKDVIATWITEEGICYNTVRFKKLGLAPPRTYADLAVPALAGRVMIPDITSGGGLSAVAGMSIAQGGSLDNIKPALDLIRKMKGVKFWKRGSQALTAMKEGDIDAAVIHAGWCVRALNAGLPVATAQPVINATTTGVVKQGWIGVVRGTKNAKAANIWINEFISTAFQTPFSKTRGVVSENHQAAANLKDDPVLNKLMILDPKGLEHMLRVDFSKVDMTSWNEQWNRSVSR